MPSSNLALAPDVVHLVWEVQPRRVLDVGPGRGKYGMLLREYVGTLAWRNGPLERIDAVELEASYRGWLHNVGVYDRVLAGDGLAVPDEFLAGYDVVLLVDVIEHMPKADATELLARIPGAVVICTPVEFFPQDDPALPESERHVSHWTLDDFARTGRMERGYTKLGGILVRLGRRP